MELVPWSIDMLVPSTISYIEFAEQYLKENRPCLIDQELTASWKARKLWQEGGKPSLEYLKKEFGESQVPVADCNDIQFSSHPKQTWSFAAYIDYWKQYNISLNSSSDKNTEKRQLYLKDWHFTRDYPDYGLYTTPHVFSIDWLNEVWDQEPPVAEDQHQVKDDYRFVYMGPKGTWTPFHVDVFRSYSWSVNVCGLKEWLIYPPGEEDHLRDKYGNLPLDVTATELQDTSMYPNAHKAIKPLHVIQGIGQAIFIPSGWHHQVKNLEDTISINHNWTNGFGIVYTWKYLKTELILVEKEIDDCRSMEGWSEQCQVILRSDAGMNINDFYQFILKIIHPRLERLKKLTEALRQESKTVFYRPLGQELFCETPRKEDISFLMSLLPQDIASSVSLSAFKADEKQLLLLHLLFELCEASKILTEMINHYTEHCPRTDDDGHVIDVQTEIKKLLLK